MRSLLEMFFHLNVLLTLTAVTIALPSSKREKSPYEVLGVPRNADEKDIKKAFHKQAMKYHPDKNKDPDAEAKFMEIGKAYETLIDPEKRREYDLYGGDLNSGGPNSPHHQHSYEDMLNNFNKMFNYQGFATNDQVGENVFMFNNPFDVQFHGGTDVNKRDDSMDSVEALIPGFADHPHKDIILNHLKEHQENVRVAEEFLKSHNAAFEKFSDRYNMDTNGDMNAFPDKTSSKTEQSVEDGILRALSAILEAQNSIMPIENILMKNVPEFDDNSNISREREKPDNPLNTLESSQIFQKLIPGFADHPHKDQVIDHFMSHQENIQRLEQLLAENNAGLAGRQCQTIQRTRGNVIFTERVCN